MQAASIRPDTAAYGAVIDLLWCSGILGAQQRAQQLFQLACRQSITGMEAVREPAQDDSHTLEVTNVFQLGCPSTFLMMMGTTLYTSAP